MTLAAAPRQRKRRLGRYVNPDASSLVQIDVRSQKVIATVHCQADSLLSSLIDRTRSQSSSFRRLHSDDAITSAPLVDPCVLAARYLSPSPSAEVLRQPAARHLNRGIALSTRRYASASRPLSAIKCIHVFPTDPSVPLPALCLPQSRMVTLQKPAPSASSRRHLPTSDL
jgi:hypothetical protein